jgi:hypothetical protein
VPHVDDVGQLSFWQHYARSDLHVSKSCAARTAKSFDASGLEAFDAGDLTRNRRVVDPCVASGRSGRAPAGDCFRRRSRWPGHWQPRPPGRRVRAVRCGPRRRKGVRSPAVGSRLHGRPDDLISRFPHGSARGS